MSQPSAVSRPVTVPEFRAAKGRAEKLTVVTAYDCTAAKLVDAAGVDAILVGDSLGTVVQGHPNTLPVTLAQMVYHTSLVVRGTARALVVADLPFLTYQVSPRQAVKNAGKLLKQGGAAAVKMEGGERTAEAIAACVRADVPVMGHVGLTPQSVNRFGGFKVQRDAEHILADARAIEQAGAFALVIECVPSDLAARITAAVSIPTIGIGAGPHCDGQVLVYHDLLGLFDGFRPKFVKRYAELGEATRAAVRAYCAEVRKGTFPGPEHEFK
ncbi:3-methyl-2-oxobutanoate hydroxymethyltransferase [Fimbriiglobus ruber]|uniref:3-methyl-2-oxobutanoate hydroxymethyltransferase n=1 Tax=Fimbriiglobus ruber TaxID=1908690 RepID=A0A225DHE5_9BACT|nr:3-methyl-2-oxobutanoate hydroxymethyltransferase [Fimbriiglobus ruber]OWK40910.1 3-methyl-2-oxobutanoate hydroxymethyltransferase [Fimbriiglobus ruber]